MSNKKTVNNNVIRMSSNNEPFDIVNVNKNIDYFKNLIKNLEEKRQKQVEELNRTINTLNQCRLDLDSFREIQFDYLAQMMNKNEKKTNNEGSPYIKTSFNIDGNHYCRFKFETDDVFDELVRRCKVNNLSAMCKLFSISHVYYKYDGQKREADCDIPFCGVDTIVSDTISNHITRNDTVIILERPVNLTINTECNINKKEFVVYIYYDGFDDTVELTKIELEILE